MAALFNGALLPGDGRAGSTPEMAGGWSFILIGFSYGL
jgi:hypothetical protein